MGGDGVVRPYGDERAQGSATGGEGNRPSGARAADPGLFRPTEQQGGTWDVFYWVEALEPLFEELKARGASVAYPPVVQPYGMREFAVRDLNGYVLGYGEVWPVRAGQ